MVDWHRKFDCIARIARQSLLLDSDVKHSPQNTEFLMHRHGLKFPTVPDAQLGVNPPSRVESMLQVTLDGLGCDIRKAHAAEGRSNELDRIKIHQMRFSRTERWLRPQFYVPIRPFTKGQVLTSETA